MDRANITANYDNSVYTVDRITFVSYQKLHKEFESLKKTGKFYNNDGTLFGKKFRVICCDEAHSVMEAVFSQAFNTILDDMFSFFKRSVAYTFISATMECVERLIYEKGCERLAALAVSFPPNPYYPRTYFKSVPTFRKFVLPNTYENYHVSYMLKTEEIIDLYDNLSEDRKLMVFVSSKEDGYKLQDMMEDSVFIFAETETEKLSEEARIEYENIVLNEKFECRCLICTKILDAGANIKDEKLRDIVIATEDGKSEFLQITGRKRNPSKSQVNLYIMARDKQYFLNKRFNCKKKLMALCEIDYCNYCKSHKKGASCEYCSKDFTKKYFSSSSDLKLLDGLYQISGDKVIVNEMARKKLQSDVDYYDEVISDFDIYGDKTFILKQLSWLGLEGQYSDNNYYLTDNIPLNKNDLIAFLYDNIDNVMDTSKSQNTFRKKFQEIAVKLKYYTKRSENVIGLSKINKILSENNISFKVESDTDKGLTIWRVCRYEWNN